MKSEAKAETESLRIIDKFFDSMMESFIFFLVRIRDLRHRTNSLPPPSYYGIRALKIDECQQCSYRITENRQLQNAINELEAELEELRSQ